MEQSMFILLLGVVLGCVVASGIWAVLWTLIKGDKRLQKDRIDIMRNIAVLCAEIDGTIARRADSGAAFTDFQSSLSPLLEKIHRNLTVSMPLLDVYYVKYIESLIARYEQAATQVPGAEKAATVTGKAATAAFPSTVAEKDAVVPQARQAHEVRLEDSGAITATASNFEVTQQYEPAKEKPGPEAPDKTSAVVKKPGETAPENISEVDIEEMIKTQKFELKEESAKTVKQQHQDEHFISGEDVIDKLDSFFGFDNK